MPRILSLSINFQPSESGRKAGLSMNEKKTVSSNFSRAVMGRGWSLATHGTRTTAPRGRRPPAPCLGMAGRALAPTAPYLCGVQGVGSGSAFGQLALWRLLSAPDRASGRQELPPVPANHTSGPATPVWVQDVLSASERASRRATSAASRRARGRSLVERRPLSRPGSRRSAARSRWT